MPMRVLSPAKINWSLRVLGRRGDGFHDLETLFQTISLHDVLTFTPARETTLVCDDPSIPTDESNLILRAARALAAPPVAIELQKRIPAGGGLGGGSSNAATTLRALNELFDLGFEDFDLAEIALRLGSDVPFFLVGGTAYATGRGEELAAMQPAPKIPLLLLFPDERMLTPEAFRMLRRFSAPLGMERYAEILAAGLLPDAGELTNDFEEPVFAKLPRLGELRQRLLDAGATWARMSGSGSTIVGAFRDVASRDAARAAFSDVRCEADRAFNGVRCASAEPV
jgi:4-diphosphocytidyl-2-C-methyl-D-erythritol kinase